MKELIRLVASALWLEGSWSVSSVVGHLALSVVPEPLARLPHLSWLTDWSFLNNLSPHLPTPLPNTTLVPASIFEPRVSTVFILLLQTLSAFLLSLVVFFVQTQTCKLFSTARYRFYKFTRMFVMPTLFYNRVQAKCKTAVIGSWRDLFLPLIWYESQLELEDLIKIIVE